MFVGGTLPKSYGYVSIPLYTLLEFVVEKKSANKLLMSHRYRNNGWTSFWIDKIIEFVGFTL